MSFDINLDAAMAADYDKLTRNLQVLEAHRFNSAQTEFVRGVFANWDDLDADLVQSQVLPQLKPVFRDNRGVRKAIEQIAEVAMKYSEVEVVDELISSMLLDSMTRWTLNWVEENPTVKVQGKKKADKKAKKHSKKKAADLAPASSSKAEAKDLKSLKSELRKLEKENFDQAQFGFITELLGRWDDIEGTKAELKEISKGLKSVFSSKSKKRESILKIVKITARHAESGEVSRLMRDAIVRSMAKWHVYKH